jgi:hypothetical protein
VIAGVAVALVLALPLPSSASPDSPVPAVPASVAADGDRGISHARARSLLREVRAALDPGTAAAYGRPRTDLTSQLLELRRALPALSPSERAAADSVLLAFPPPRSNCANGLTEKVVTTGHFCVHYSNGDTGWATTTAQTLEQVWSVEVDALRFRPPPPDGDSLFDVYLQDLGAGYYGACAPAEDASRSVSSCVLDDDFDPAEFGGAPAIDSLQVTAAHEFFHAVQFGYDTTEDIWLMEGSAVWAEEQVFPAINDYLQYLPFSAITQPRTPVDYKGVSGADLYFRYGAGLFWKFLSEHFGDPAVVRRVWEFAEGAPYSLQAVAAAVGERGWSFGRAFARFGVWNTQPPGSYADRGLFPAPSWWIVTRLGRGHRDTGRQAVTLDHLTNAALLARPARRLPRHTRVRIRVDAPDLVRMPQATVQVRRRNGTVRVLDVPLNGAGDGSLLVGFDPRVVDAVAVTLTNASTRMSSCWTDGADRYSCGGQSADDGLDFGVRARLRLPR